MATPLQVAGICKRWPGQRRQVLVDVALHLEAGEAIHVTGANGAGKTTLLRIICGLVDADAGSVAVDGQDITRDRLRARTKVSYLPAGSTAVYARLTVRQHCELWGRLTLVPRAQLERRIRAVLDAFALGELAGRRADRLSSGQRQRMRVALAFLSPAQLLLLDEPLTSLDEDGVARTHAALADRLSHGAAVVWCAPDTHAVPAGARSGRLVGGRLEVT